MSVILQRGIFFLKSLLDGGDQKTNGCDHATIGPCNHWSLKFKHLGSLLIILLQRLGAIEGEREMHYKYI